MPGNLDTLIFLRDELLRFAQMDIPTLKTLSFEDHISSIPHAEGKGSMLCGIAAMRRIERAVELAISSAGLFGRVDPAKVRDIVIEAIVEQFLRQRRAVTLSSADRLFSRSVKTAAQAIRPITHFIPCLISEGDEPAEFHVGKIHFQRCKGRLERLQPLFEKYLADSEKSDGIRDPLLGQTLKYYEAFDWIAEVTIEDADLKSSRKLANGAVEAALNFLHMLLGARFSSHLRVGGPSLVMDKRGRFAISDGAICDVELLHSWLRRDLGKGWWEHFNNLGATQLLPIVGKVVDNSLTLKPAPLTRRLLDAAHWYGDAAREKFPASQIVKFVTAIERILVTKKEKDLTDTVCTRGSALTCCPRRERMAEERQRFSRVYDARSRFVHGSSSPFDRKFLNVLSDAEDLSRAVLWSALIFFDQDGRITEPGVTDKRLGIGFDRLVEWMKTPTDGMAAP